MKQKQPIKCFNTRAYKLNNNNKKNEEKEKTKIIFNTYTCKTE
jgi:hypothetical protein